MKKDDDDDPVVEEIPVYLSKTLFNKLYVFQYPVRLSHHSYDNERILKSCIKPEHQEVRLEVGINTRSPNYDTSKGEQIALNVDGSGPTKKKTEDRHFMSNLMDKQILESARAVTDVSRYAVGVLHDKEFHLTPVRGIVHLRPSFGYLDKSDKRAKEMAKEMGEGGDQSEEEEEAKQVTVKFARQENERIKRARERSFGYLSRKSAEEPWYHTDYYNSQSEQAERERSNLYCSVTEERPSQLVLTKEQYMNVLIPQTTDAASTSTGTTPVVIPLNRLRLLPLLDQVRHLLLEAKLLQFSKLLSLIGHGHDPVNVLRTVQQVAVLVQGNWVVRSDILFPKDSASDTCGIPAELMWRARDYMLCLFTQHHYVVRNQICAAVKLPGEEVKILLSQIARLRPNKCWELLLPYDADFISRYSEVAHRQQKIWEAKLKQFSELFGSNLPVMANNVQSNLDNENGGTKVNDTTVNATIKYNHCSVPNNVKRTNPVPIKVEPMDKVIKVEPLDTPIKVEPMDT